MFRFGGIARLFLNSVLTVLATLIFSLLCSLANTAEKSFALLLLFFLENALVEACVCFEVFCFSVYFSYNLLVKLLSR